MRSLSFLILAFFITSLSSCTTHKATVKTQQEQNYGLVKVEPLWTYKSQAGKKSIMPMVGLGAGIAIGLKNSITLQGEVLPAGGESAALLGMAGVLSGVIVNAFLFPRKKRNKTFELRDSEKWLTKFNNEKRANYVLLTKNPDKTLILAPRSTLTTVRAEIRSFQQELGKTKPNLSTTELGQWKGKLERDYLFMPAKEIRAAKESLDANESRIAGFELVSKAETMMHLDNTIHSLNTIISTKNTLTQGSLYKTADESSKKQFDSLVNKKHNDLLSALMNQEELELRKISLDLDGLASVNQWAKDFNSKYTSVKNNPSVLKTWTAYSRKAEGFTQAIAEVEKEISKAFIEATVNRLENQYFSELPADSGDKLRNLANTKRTEIETIARNRELERKKREAEKLREAESRFGEFVTNRLSNEKDVREIFKGNFQALSFNRRDSKLKNLGEEYLRVYSDNCFNYLSHNKMELTKRVCNKWRVKENNWGIETSRTCINWIDEKMNISVNPDMYVAYGNIRAELESNAIGGIMNMLANPYSWGDYIAGSLDKISRLSAEKERLKTDINLLVMQNGCLNKGLKRFEENLQRLMMGNPPLKLTD